MYEKSWSEAGELNFLDFKKTMRNLLIWTAPWIIMQLQTLQYGVPIDYKAFVFWVVISTLIELFRRLTTDNQ